MTTIHSNIKTSPARLAGSSRRTFIATLPGLLATLLIHSTPSKGFSSAQPGSGTVLHAGDIVYVDSGDGPHGGFVIKVDPLTAEKTIISSGGLLRTPFGVTIDARGQIIVSDSGRLIRIDPVTGYQSLLVDNSGGKLGLPCGLVMERPNSIVAANLQGVVRVDGDSGHVQILWASGSRVYPVCVAVAENGDLIALSMGFPAEIVRVRPNGEKIVLTSGGLLHNPQAIAVIGSHAYVTDVVDPNGNFGTGRIIDIDINTRDQSILTEGQCLCGPVGIAVDPEGHLIVGDPYTVNDKSPDLFDGAIIRIDRDTRQQEIITRGEGSFVNPRGVTVVPGLNP